MEFRLDLPYLSDNILVQRFRARSGKNVFKGTVKYTPESTDSINSKRLAEILEDAIRDAARGLEYRMVGRISDYKYRIVLKNEPISYAKVSSVEIRVYDDQCNEKICIWARPA